jgi:Na+-transporting methylmalonyl-CoA/oxaloacetate decarboxylase gamma subunit
MSRVALWGSAARRREYINGPSSPTFGVSCTTRYPPAVHLSPNEYLIPGVQFTRENFPDLFDPIWIASLIFFVGAIVLYNVRQRQLHRHEPLRAMQEWLLWTGLITFGLVLVGTVFSFYFLFILIFIISGILAFIWIRFYRFPPYIEAYNEQLRRARFFSQSKYKAADATVRTRRRGGSRRRRS